MKIYSINTVNNNTFKSNYKDIKVIPNLICACCGEKTINPMKMTDAYRAITKPLSTILKKGYLDYQSKFPAVWQKLNDLAQKYPSKSLDKILENGDEYSGLKSSIVKSMKENSNIEFNSMTEYQINDEINNIYHSILTTSRKELRSASKVMKRLSSFKECLSGEKLAAFEQLEIYAQKYPKKSISEIIKMNHIYNFHSTKDLLQRAETREKLDYHYNNILEMISEKNPNARDFFIELKDKALELYNMGDLEKARYLINKLYIDALKEHNCEKLTDKVLEELKQTPITFITKDSFLAYAAKHNFDDISIIYSLLKPSVASFEHIKPKWAKGGDNIANGIVMCRKCNQMRDRTPYSEFIEYHPRMPYNTQKQIMQIADFILNGKLNDEYKFWPIEVARTLEEYTDGKIKPDISDYCKRGSKKIKRIEQQRSAIIDDKIAQIEENKAKKEALLKELQELEAENKTLKDERSNLIRESARDRALNRQMKEYIENSSNS